MALAFFVGRYVAPPIINFLSHFEEEFEELPFFFALGLGFGFGVLGAYLGYSAAVGAFIIGLAIRGKHSKFLAGKVAPVKGLLVFVFFVYMGSLIDPFPALAIWPYFAARDGPPDRREVRGGSWSAGSSGRGTPSERPTRGWWAPGWCPGASSPSS